MLLIRRFEEKTAEMYQRAKIGGYCHLNLGEEATVRRPVPRACSPATTCLPTIVSTATRWRAASSPGGSWPSCSAAKAASRSGRGGSMHLFDIDKRLMGGYAIVGGQLPLATGAGLAIVRKGEPDAVVCQMGDATTNIGAFHESLNLAALWKLPVVYVDRQQRLRHGHVASRPARRSSQLHEKACAYGIPGVEVDGNDVLAVRDAAREAVERARTETHPHA